MSAPGEAVTLDADEEAHRLWQGALAALGASDHELTSLSEALDLGLRAVEVLAFRRLEGARDQFPAPIAALFDSPGPEIDVERDAVESPRALGFTDVLDLLSDDELECVAPDLHRGWEDRRFSCRRSRATARRALEIQLGAEERRPLLLLAAYRNRIFRRPPPVRLVTADIRRAFPALRALVARLSQ